uniref:Transmembrane protein 69 n=1 Tax=Pediculus humanus subsp. corporis TaxID=121224 RepID=A0A2Y9D450_PEDHC
MYRILPLRCSGSIRRIFIQKNLFYRCQHETVRASDDLVQRVSKEVKEDVVSSSGPTFNAQNAANSMYNQNIKYDDSSLRRMPGETTANVKMSSMMNTGEEYWKNFYKKYKNGNVNANDVVTLFKGVYAEAQYAKYKEAPSAYYTLSCCGMVPLCSIGLFSFITGGVFPWLAYAQLTYSASLLSFLGGVNWGNLINQKNVTMDKLGWAVASPVLAWSAVLLPLPIGFLFAAAGLTTSMIHDILLTNYPQWFKSTRYILTVVALISLLPTFFITVVKF